MQITLKLSEEEVHALRPLADAAGVTVETVLHHLIAQLLPPVAPEMPAKLKQDHTEDKQDHAEDKAEEDAERRREQAEIQANIKRWHAEQTHRETS